MWYHLRETFEDLFDVVFGIIYVMLKTIGYILGGAILVAPIMLAIGYSAWWLCLYFLYPVAVALFRWIQSELYRAAIEKYKEK